MVFNSTRETKSYRPGLEIPTRSWTGNLPAITSTGSVRRVQSLPTFGTGTARWNRIHCAKLTSTHNAGKPSRTSIALVSFPNLFPLALPTAHIQLGFSQVTSFPILGVDPYRNYVSEVPNGLRRRSTTLHTSRDLVENLHRRKKIYQLTTKSFHLTRPWKTLPENKRPTPFYGYWTTNSSLSRRKTDRLNCRPEQKFFSLWSRVS